MAGPFTPRPSRRFNGLRPRFRDQDYGTTFVTERPPQFARQIFPVSLGKQRVAIDEEQKGRRGLPDLCRVKNFSRCPARADGLTPPDRVMQRAIQNRLKFFYATQVRQAPPTFLLFVNRDALFSEAYRKYLAGELRRRSVTKVVP